MPYMIVMIFVRVNYFLIIFKNIKTLNSYFISQYNK
jgi:hypothetical protein